MNADLLKKLVLEHLDQSEIPEAAQSSYVFAILDEVCETITTQHPEMSLPELVTPTIVAFYVGLSSFQGMVNAGLQQGDQVTLNYRGQTFVFHAPIGQ